MTEQFDSKTFLKTVTSQPGVYRMYDTSGTVIYVGKAKDLKKRLSSYFRAQVASRKTESLVKNIVQIDVTVTHTETEALLLEHNYIKLYQPRYNVLLRDDKSYPYIFLSADKHPRLAMHRGAKHAKGEYFGPFPNTHAVRESLTLLQKLFPIRQCEDSVYRNRSRPCLQYQIGRCLGPCVKGLVSEEEYQQQVDYIRLFLSGKDQQVLTRLIDRMEQASQQLKFEDAARYRDQIQAVRQVTERQFVSGTDDDLDVISVAFEAGMACLHVLFIRQGKVLGSRSYYPKVPTGTKLDEIVQTFLGQFYLQGSQNRTLPSAILLDFTLPEKDILSDSLSEISGRKIHIQTRPRGDKARYLKLARTNATIALETRLSQQSTIHQRLDSLAKLVKLAKIQRIECFDISHTMGEQTVASCVVFDSNGPLRSEYRRYNISGITPGDDYAAMNQVLRRRYGKALDESKIPDIIFIDGGKGQLAQAIDVFQSLDVEWDKTRPQLIGVAKGSDRKAGLETLFFATEDKGIALPPDSPALHVIQHIRDESHNHAITGHRQRRSKVRNTSTLESIEGVGPKRRQMLLKYMGGLQPLRNASVEEIAKVPTISYALAEKIYNALKH
ncbi:excinuclease ABC subunit UvrC [Photorhabdus antumapuensis]|uniref:excinuclease ABC subunit UvrC n=1 Tax=Photorhabdus antumapuensis TaxID=2862867 RepID=UPI001CEC669B|nr:excinuclease ABC subunit UvrC [Photorhabdus antumapuensis]MCA6220086.1 excinuclease ABC subunit UvrC [Photorhabdus antumapuensis]